MHLIVVLISLGLLQVWGAKNPLHRDEFFHGWMDMKYCPKWLRGKPRFHMAWTLLLPVLALTAVFMWLPAWLWMVAATIVLLYSLGRGEFAPHIENYTQACGDDRWPDALSEAKSQGIDIDNIDDRDWPELHQRILGDAAYQGFERMFCVLFWFVLFGPAGALLYRLSFIYTQEFQEVEAKRWLWALEWPVVRVLGLSFAVTGNFVGCINRWKIYIFCQTRESSYILSESILGALSVDDELMQSCDCTQREIVALKYLYARTLWFWVGVIAVWGIMY